MIKLMMICSVLCFAGSLLIYAQRRKVAMTNPTMTEAQCLTWLHGNGSYDGRSEMLAHAYGKTRVLTAQCIDAANKEINEALQRLVDAKRITTPHPMSDYYTVAQHRWFSAPIGLIKNRASNAHYGENDSTGEMGLYVFDQGLFDLAMRSWHTNVFMEKGSDIVQAPDVTFDKSVVGYQTYIVTDQDRDGDDCKTWRAGLEAERKEREAKGRTLQDDIDDFNKAGTTVTWSVSNEPWIAPPEPQPSTVVEFIDAHTIRISRKAKSCKDGWAAQFVPAQWSH